MADEHIYIIEPLDPKFRKRMPIKIGTSVDVKSRLRRMLQCSPIELRIYSSFTTKSGSSMRCSRAEAEIHYAHRDKHSHGEWFFLSSVEAARDIRRLLIYYDEHHYKEPSKLKNNHIKDRMVDKFGNPIVVDALGRPIAPIPVNTETASVQVQKKLPDEVKKTTRGIPAAIAKRDRNSPMDKDMKRFVAA